MAKSAQKPVVTSAQIQEAYVDYVLTHDEAPKSVFNFAKNLKITETEFYNFFSSFVGIERKIWADLTFTAISEIKKQSTWPQYTSREKILSFFYSYTELLKRQRSFVTYSLKKQNKRLTTPEILTDAKKLFENFAEDIIHDGLDSGELADRKFFSKRYKDALWIQFAFIINFWVDDDSAGFEKTDEAIEKGINVTFDLFQRSPIDNIFQYGKFLMRNSKLHEKMRI